jgi:bacillithiol biosynthesis cysteine-adding enzyme BshC
MKATPLPDPTDPAARARAVDAARRRQAQPDVVASIAVMTDAQRRSLDALAAGTCVVTGQQAGLFLGPLYTLHKAACAVKTAAALAAETGVPCAPVFWLQDEDHDVDEIRSATLLSADDTLAMVSFDADPAEALRSVWARRLGPSVEGALDALEASLQGMPHAAEVVALHRRAYTPSASPSQAFRQVLERLFAPHGLLVVDPADPRLVDAARPVFAQAIDQAAPIAEALARQAAALQAAGQPAPVHVRPGSPLVFVHPDGRSGPRYRVAPREGGWELVGADRGMSGDELRRAAHSSSALLRPILQDRWLPTAAIIGGPGELAYLAQVPPLWEAFGLPVPLVVARSRYVVVDGPSPRLLEQLGLTAAELQRDREALLRRLARPRDGLDPDALLAHLTQGLPLPASAHEGPLARSARRTEATIRRAAERFAGRVRRQLAASDALLVDRLDRAQRRMAPGGAPQERVHAWPVYGARHGVDRFVQSLLDAVVPFDGSLRELSP